MFREMPGNCQCPDHMAPAGGVNPVQNPGPNPPTRYRMARDEHAALMSGVRRLEFAQVNNKIQEVPWGAEKSHKRDRAFNGE